MERSKALEGIRRLVVKVGTASITEDLRLCDSKILKIASEVQELRKGGKDVILVSSGAIAAGIRKLGLRQRPRDLNMLQATAAVGQNELMTAYSKAFNQYGVNVAQILLTRDDFQSRNRYLRIREIINTLLEAKVVPIINENDSVAVDEIKFGDNDTLSALVASNLGADILVLMSSMDGLYDRDPTKSKDAVKISEVDRISGEISSLDGKSRMGGVGGISSKIKAAKVMMDCGIPMAIVDAAMGGVLSRLLRGEPVGTVFIPKRKIENKQQWMLFSSATKGIVAVDDGARQILLRGKASLLPSGIISARGLFKSGDAVMLVDSHGIEFARGIINFGFSELELIIGRHSKEIEAILGKKTKREAINSDNLVMLEK
jgi:glutamate 5-kinase